MQRRLGRPGWLNGEAGRLAYRDTTRRGAAEHAVLVLLRVVDAHAEGRDLHVPVYRHRDVAEAARGYAYVGREFVGRDRGGCSCRDADMGDSILLDKNLNKNEGPTRTHPRYQRDGEGKQAR